MLKIRAEEKFKILKSRHFWVIALITLGLVFIYQAWPWREMQLGYGIWRWFYWLSFLSHLAVFEINMRIVGSLLLIPIIYATLVFRWQISIFFLLIALAGILPLIIQIWSTVSLVTNIVFLLLPAIISLFIRIEIELRRRDRLTFIQEQQRYTSFMLEAQEKERKRIANELHDETIQTLVAIAKKSETLGGSKDNKDILWIKNEIVHTIENIRRITLDLRPSILDDLGLIPALRWLVDRINTESNINTQIQVKGIECKLSEYSEIAIFRIVQEALNNIKYHSNAREAKVLLDFGTKSLRITIEDNGSGILPFERISDLISKGKQGLIGIRERIKLLGAKYEINSNPGKGTTLSIEINYEK